jgi:hypothetical protein
MWIKFLRGLLCATLALVTLELSARVDDYRTIGANPFDSYDFTQLMARDKAGPTGRPNGRFVKWRMNSLGFRGPELRQGTLRVVCFGTSETFGMFEPADAEYPRLLENQLDSRDGRRGIEVVNVGLPAVSLASMIPHAPSIVQRVHPAVFLIYPSFAAYIWARSDDTLGTVHRLEELPAPGAAIRTGTPWWTPRLLQKLGTLRTLA